MTIEKTGLEYLHTDKNEILLELNSILSAFNRMKIYKSNLTCNPVLPYDREGLNKQEQSALTSLHDVGKVTMGQLAVACGFTASKTTRCVDALTKKGFIDREFDPNNRRIIWVKPSKLGYDLTEENVNAIYCNFKLLTEEIPEEDLDKMIEAYETLIFAYHKYCGLMISVADFTNSINQNSPEENQQ